MSANKELLRLATTIQSINLVEANLKVLKKKKKKSKELIKTGVNNVVGSALIKEQSDFINSF